MPRSIPNKATAGPYSQLLLLNGEEGRGGEQQRGGIAVTLPIFPSPLFLLSFTTQGFLTALLITFNFFLLPQSSDFLGSAKVQEMMLLKAAEIIFPQIPDMPWEDTSAWLHRLCILLSSVKETVLELLPLSSRACPTKLLHPV